MNLDLSEGTVLEFKSNQKVWEGGREGGRGGVVGCQEDEDEIWICRRGRCWSLSRIRRYGREGGRGVCI